MKVYKADEYILGDGMGGNRNNLEGILMFGHWWRKKKGEYFERNVTLHQEIWESYYGPVPEGCSIHHRDSNKTNNSIDNLECMPNQYHKWFHCHEKEKEFICENCLKQFTGCISNHGNRFCSKKCSNRYHKVKVALRSGKDISGRLKTFLKYLGIPLMLPFIPPQQPKLTYAT